jgi:phage-related protein
MTNQKEKPLAWLGSSKKDLMALPVGVACFPEKEQERHDNTKARHGYHPRTTESRGKAFTGDAE